jgi:hypothetical protein
MKLSIEHTFPVSPAEYADLFFGEEFSIELCAALKLGRTVLRFDRSGDRIVRHVRVQPVRDIPAPLAKLIDGGAFHYVEELDVDLKTLRGVWRVVPSVLPSKVNASGTLEFAPVAAGVRRVVLGDISVGVFGVGGMVEKFVVTEVARSYDDAATFTRVYLERHPLRGSSHP